ncbi:MAG: mechanosensitive ion channel family protein [Lautropia sp.]|nr:mechanosensitive ion channel family protein [Lautropia sp.]
MLTALRVARATSLRLSSHGDLHGAGSAAGVIAEILGGTSQRLMLLTALLIGVGTLHLAEPWSNRVSHLWFLTLMLQFALWANRAVTLGLGRYFKRHAGDGGPARASSTLLSWALRTALWAVAALAVLSNVGVNITAFVASLGIGGVAIALAVQNILGDLFASLSIAVDKPFEVGDAIGVGAVSGNVEYVGLKTTRIRSVDGEQVVMGNAALLKQTVSNYKRMATRRVVLSFGVTYDTTPEQMEAIPALSRSLIEADERVRFGRAHFKNFGDSALNFEVVYTVLSPDYDLFMDLQQKFNLQLMRELKQIGVAFAFPSRTVYLAGEAQPALAGQSAPVPLPAARNHPSSATPAAQAPI